MTTAVAVEEIPVPDPASGPYGLANGPDSVERDRDAKHRKYAAAGIQHYRRVENDNGRAVVYAFELEPATRTYAPVGIFHDQLKLSFPFPVDIDLTEVQTPRL